jgi:AraC-like DNA-binding protein
MSIAAPLMRVADGDSFKATSRMLFGPITQRFVKDVVIAAPRLVSMHLGACRLSEIKANPHIVVSDHLLRRSFDPDAIKILMQVSGESRFEQQAVTVNLSRRSAIIYDPVRTYSLQNLSAVDQLILQVPRSTFNDEALARLAEPIPLLAEDDSLARIVSGLMQMAISEAERLDEAGCRRVGDSLVQLVHGLIRGEPSAPPELRRSPLKALRERIVAYIDSHLGQSDLGPEEIARHMGCSRRYLHRAFEGEDVTLERFIWNRRLEASKEALLAPERSASSISEIAFACGFNSSAHFSRAFKQRYNVAPRDLRANVIAH